MPARRIFAALALALASPATAGAEPLDAVDGQLEVLVGMAAGQGRYVVDWAEPTRADGEVSGLHYDPRARTLAANLHEEGGASRPITGRVRLLALVPTPARTVAQGEILTEADLGLMEVDLLTAHRDTVTSEGSLTDHAARRRLEPGRPILARDVRAVPAVQRNDLVTIVAATGRIAVRARAKALDTGGIGQMVRVQNVDSRKVTTGTVVGRGLVDAGRGAP
jgi:flagella basal body P-ring formation protein FlgA